MEFWAVLAHIGSVARMFIYITSGFDGARGGACCILISSKYLVVLVFWINFQLLVTISLIGGFKGL